MDDPRERMFRRMVSDFPQNAMAHFSLGSHLLGERRFVEAALSFEEATRLQADYAAAWVALGDARAACGEGPKARDAYAAARAHALAQGHHGLAEEVDAKVAKL